jgi:hypothetical protein
MKGMRRPLDICFWLGLLIAGAGTLWAFWPTPNVDPDYYARVRNQAFRRGPSVLFDEAHWNGVSAHGNYAPFVQLIRRDGYRVYRNKQEFVPELLAGYNILIIVNPRGLRGAPLAQEENRFVAEWVHKGGNLLLAAGSGSLALTEAFGVRLNADSAASGEPAIGDHPIVNGRPDGDESLRRLAFFGGQTLSGREAFLGKQAIATEHGAGRVVVIGDPMALTAQLIDRQRLGINNRNYDNHQLVLNIMHWLSRLI